MREAEEEEVDENGTPTEEKPEEVEGNGGLEGGLRNRKHKET